jgi:predicted component of type VI protein secretion system
MRAVLLGSSGPVLGREYPLDADLVTIGRRDENAIVIKDPTVSRKHAEIRRAGDDFLVVDKNSTSGVLLNGVPISGEQRLKDGDRLGIGMSAVFLVQLQPAEDATVTFAQPQFGDRERTQFVTRTELDDPRGIVADPPPAAAARVAPAPTPPRETPPQVAPAFIPVPAPPPPPREAPPVAPLPAAPDFSFQPGGGSTPPPTHSAAPLPPFSAAPAPPQYTPPGYAPSYSQPSAQGNASWPAQQMASAPVAPPAKSRRGLVIGLVLLVLIILIVLAIVAFILIRR